MEASKKPERILTRIHKIQGASANEPTQNDLGSGKEVLDSEGEIWQRRRLWTYSVTVHGMMIILTETLRWKKLFSYCSWTSFLEEVADSKDMDFKSSDNEPIEFHFDEVLPEESSTGPVTLPPQIPSPPRHERSESSEDNVSQRLAFITKSPLWFTMLYFSASCFNFIVNSGIKEE
eukprot:Gb_02735 [translate_table: standard]